MTIKDSTVSPREQEGSNVHAMEQELSYEEAVKQLRKEVQGLIVAVANSEGKTVEEVNALKAVMERKCSDLEAIKKALSMVLPTQSSP